MDQELQHDREGERSRPRYWLGVVSRHHVERGVAGGFAQLCHGKRAPLARMRAGDWLVYYSPRTEMDGGEPLQAFTAIGRVTGTAVYEHAMSADFVPHRRDVAYVPCQPAPIQPLVSRLSFVKNPKRWGFPLRRGVLPLTASDFALIARAMNAAINRS
jgi:EVE domain-containing protein